MASLSGFASSVVGHAGHAKASYRAFNNALSQTALGRAAQRGFGEALGFSYQGPFFGEQASRGWLGMRGTAGGRAFSGVYAKTNSFMKAGRAGMKSSMHAARKLGWKGSIKGAGKAAFGGLGLAFTAFSVYQGYQEGGALGAARGGAEAIATSTIANVAFRAVGLAATPLAVVAGVAAAGYGAYRFGEASRAHGKRMRNLEMGSDLVDSFGTMSTMRQRSLNALQSTHLNGRMGFGNEAALMHVPMMR